MARNETEVDPVSEETKPTESQEQNGDSLPEMHRMVDMGSAVTRTAHGNIHCLTIVGQIEGHMLAAQGTPWAVMWRRDWVLQN